MEHLNWTPRIYQPLAARRFPCSHHPSLRFLGHEPEKYGFVQEWCRPQSVLFEFSEILNADTGNDDQTENGMPHF